MSKWSSRKFISLWVFTMLWTVLLIEKILSGGNYVSLMGFSVASYFAANIGEHFAHRGQ